MISCDAIRQRLAEDGVEAAELHAEIRHHLEACAPCTNFLAQLQAVDSALEELPLHDASDELVADTLRAVRQAAVRRDGERTRLRHGRASRGTISPAA